ncbi:MAG: inositol phosphorylceramide synthase [Methanosarcinaceae archaeon]|nr:inositol phosphorylceramide synthase [Methanosarcinaceae archaeon]
MADIQLMIILVSVVFLMNIVAYYVFIPQRYRMKNYVLVNENRSVYLFSSKILSYLLLLSFIFILIRSQGLIAGMFSPDYGLSKFIFNIEGSSVSMFQTFTNPLLTYLSAFIYLFGFSFLLVFTFVIFILTRQPKAFQEYSIAVLIIYMVGFLFYIFTPVKATGYTLPNVVPLLYNLNPVILEGLKIIDPFFDNCFPSLHAALSFLAMLFILFRTDLKGFKVFAIFITLTIQFTIFYLGIHWITDFIGGTILAALSFFVATKYHDLIVSKLHISSGRND